MGRCAETGDAPGRRQMAMPMREGDVLNLRDLDQTLECSQTICQPRCHRRCGLDVIRLERVSGKTRHFS
ncbi:POTRA domain-containing protein [Cupriavidus basilensis]|uniref:POTRA domain-containing protein n=1 Tax=Cupriavidus basilensis TaxID=68895 RepID=UPI003463FA01